MQLFVFAACHGFWSVALEAETEIDRETAWLLSVPNEISGTLADIAREYNSAGVGSRSADDIRSLSRSRSSHHKMKTQAIFTPNTQPRAPPALSDRRSHYREMRQAVENHWNTVYVLIGALFGSWRAFKLASAVLSMGRSLGPTKGHSQQQVRCFWLDSKSFHWMN